MKKLVFVLSLFCLGQFLYANEGVQQDKAYHFSVDLTKVKNDKVQVELITPKIEKDKISYFLPKIVPGTYSIYDFGRFVSDFTATDQDGNKLAVEKKGENEWVISDAQKLYKISYWTEDSFDSEQENFVFEPSGTNIEDNTNFVINTHGFFWLF